MRKTISYAVLALIGTAILSGTANATFIGCTSFSGANNCLKAPDDAPIPDPVAPNPNNGILLGWDEQQNITLSSDLAVDRIADPSASFVKDIGGDLFIAAGTVVSSHYFQWDPGSGSSPSVTATLDFDSDIFAFITADQNLFDSDNALGLPGIDYNDFNLRGLEPQDTTDFSPGGDASLVDISWTASNPGDWTRLITAFSPAADDETSTVPVPPPFVLLGAGLVGLVLSRYKTAKSYHGGH